MWTRMNTIMISTASYPVEYLYRTHHRWRWSLAWDIPGWIGGLELWMSYICRCFNFLFISLLLQKSHFTIIINSILIETVQNYHHRPWVGKMKLEETNKFRKSLKTWPLSRKYWVWLNNVMWGTHSCRYWRN